MARSYEKINYSLRPAKHVERKMLCEAFRRLSEFAPIDSYRYIGFGSPYFSDFHLFHKALGITAMICIEVNEHDRERFEFNQPFRCLNLEFGHSNDVLPGLHWGDIRSIVWLDYDGALDNNVLTDIGFICAKATPASMLVITVNADSRTKEENRVGNLTKMLGEDRVPADIKEVDLAGWNRAKVFRRIIVNEIDCALNERNGGRHRNAQIQFKQLFNFHYADGAKMLSVGGLLHDQGQEPSVAKCAFEQLHFVCLDENPYQIKIPLLTYRELRHLDQQFPTVQFEQLNADKIPLKDLETYAAIYRYFPTFAEAEI